MLHVDRIDALVEYKKELEIFRINISEIIDNTFYRSLYHDNDDQRNDSGSDESEIIQLRKYFDSELGVAISRLNDFITQLERAVSTNLTTNSGSNNSTRAGMYGSSSYPQVNSNMNNSATPVRDVVGSHSNQPTVEYLGVFCGNRIHLVPISLIALHESDNALVGQETFSPGLSSKKGISYERMQNSTRAFHEVILPAVRNGANEDTFREADLRAGRSGDVESLHNYHRMYLSGDVIGLSRRSDGRYDIPAGRHRVQVANDMGYSLVPAVIDR